MWGKFGRGRLQLRGCPGSRQVEALLERAVEAPAEAVLDVAKDYTLPHLFRHLAIPSNTGPGLKIQPGRS
eukprot:14390640-Alexandrium_andersonii.AAC.1